MKKIYRQPEVEITIIRSENVMLNPASGVEGTIPGIVKADVTGLADKFNS